MVCPENTASCCFDSIVIDDSNCELEEDCETTKLLIVSMNEANVLEELLELLTVEIVLEILTVIL